MKRKIFLLLAILSLSLGFISFGIQNAGAIGEKIVFSSDRNGNYEIYVMNADGSNQTQLTNNTRTDQHPSFSPDGSKIAFHSSEVGGGNDDIYVMNADGTNQTQLTNNPGSDLRPSYSPDGSKIAFTSFREGNYDIYVMNADGSNPIRLTTHPAADFSPSFSPDGSKIAFASPRNVINRYDIYVMNVDGSNQIQLTYTGDGSHPTFSPNGSKITFHSNRNGNYQIYVMNVDGTAQMRLTNSLAGDFNPSFSPDGSKIAFDSTLNSRREIYVMNADGTNPVRLTDNYPRFNHHPSWGKQGIIPPSSYSISGRVTESNTSTGVVGVTISIGEATSPVTTDSNGNFTFSNLPNGTYIITPSQSGGTFTPSSLSVTINGANLTGIDFQRNPCTYSLSPTSASIGASGGTFNFYVSTGCFWGTSISVNWIMINSGSAGMASRNVSYSVQANTGPARTGTITIGGQGPSQTFTVNQASGCIFSLSPTSLNIAASGGNESFNITSGTDCAWTAVSNVNWINITAGSSGSGNGTIQFTVAGNTGVARSGTITIGGQTFIVSQASGCTVSLSPSGFTIIGSGGGGNVNVTAPSGCSWTAVSNANWITITSGSSGTGNGTVQFTVATYTGATRTGTITIGGQIFTVNQESPNCNISLSPASPQSFTAAGGNGTINVSAPAGCAWGAISNHPSMILITDGTTGNGNGVISFAVLANQSGSARTGSITVGNQVYTINQSGQSCTYTISSAKAVIPVAGILNGSFNVTTQAGCNWTAVSDISWITITSSGSGSGTVNYAVAENTTTSSRTATISVAGQIFTVHQAQFHPTAFDFDGDKKTDLVVYRPSNEVWYLLRSQEGYSFSLFGRASDKLVPADYDGDKKTDFAYFRESNSKWYILHSSNRNYVETPAFGQAGDIPVPGDWDGDEKADVAVYRMGEKPGDQSYFYFRGSLNNPDGNITYIPFGQNGDVPLVGDYDGDNKLDAVIFRPSVGEWWYLRSSDGANRAFQFGQNGDKPVSGDFTGDGKTDIAIFRPSTGEWFILRSEDNSYYAAPFGSNEDIPVVGDYDGDGKDDIAVWRPSDGNWYVVKSSGGFLIAPFGMAGDKPIPAVYVP